MPSQLSDSLNKAQFPDFNYCLCSLVSQRIGQQPSNPSFNIMLSHWHMKYKRIYNKTFPERRNAISLRDCPEAKSPFPWDLARLLLLRVMLMVLSPKGLGQEGSCCTAKETDFSFCNNCFFLKLSCCGGGRAYKAPSLPEGLQRIHGGLEEGLIMFHLSLRIQTVYSSQRSHKALLL